MNAPAFQFYAADFLADEAVATMTLAERGLYITLLCHCWREGSIPDNVESIGRLACRSLGEAKRLWPMVRNRFTPGVESGRLIHNRLEAEREKQRRYKEHQSEAGRLGMSKRWDKPRYNNPGNGVIATPITEDNSSSTSSSSFTSSTNDDVIVSHSQGDHEYRLHAAGLTRKQIKAALERGESFVKLSLGFLESPPDDVRNPVAVIAAAIRDGALPPTPKQKPLRPITAEHYERYGAEAERRARVRYPNASTTLPDAIDEEIRELIAEEGQDDHAA